MTRILANASADDRPATDLYSTPAEVTEALICKCQWDKESLIWEPAAGEGKMVDVFKREGYDVFASDISTGTDFTQADALEAEIIVTNPPFFRAEDFIRTARRLEPTAFAFLLKSQFWHATTRLRLFQEIRPAYIFPLAWRPDFLFGAKSSSPTMEVQWCVWVHPFDNTTTEFQPIPRPGKDNPYFDWSENEGI